MNRRLKLRALIVILLFSSITCAMAEDCTEHVWYEDSRNTYQYENSGECTPQGHIYRVYRYETCELCGAGRRTIRQEFQAEIRAHNYSIYIGDAGHVMIGVHAYWYKCSECSAQKAIQKPCNGPPCNNSMEYHTHHEDE